MLNTKIITLDAAWNIVLVMSTFFAIDTSCIGGYVWSLNCGRVEYNTVGLSGIELSPILRCVSSWIRIEYTVLRFRSGFIIKILVRTPRYVSFKPNKNCSSFWISFVSTNFFEFSHSHKANSPIASNSSSSHSNHSLF